MNDYHICLFITAGPGVLMPGRSTERRRERAEGEGEGIRRERAKEEVGAGLSHQL